MNDNIPDIIPDVLTIVHLDDRFLTGRINIISNLTDESTITVEDLLQYIIGSKNNDHSGDSKVVLEGMENLTSLIKKIRKRISECLANNKNLKIFLLNFINVDNSKSIFQPFDSQIVEIKNSVYNIDNSFEQSKTFIGKLFELGLLPTKSINMELMGVYRHACVSNISKHLNRFVRDENLMINNWINEDLTV
jgi:hypothetical protein